MDRPPESGESAPTHPLPADARRLLDELDAPPRLVAHLELVHDVAEQILRWLAEHHPDAPVDPDAVRFGAAVHDIGKVLHPRELSGPGHEHEAAGERLLLERGIAPDLARFCRTHAAWDTGPQPLEDLLVGLADKAWKGARVDALEDRVTERLLPSARHARWQVWSDLDELLTRLAADADTRIAYQMRHPER